MKYIKALDTLRFLAVLLVIREHWGPYAINSVFGATFFIQKILPTGIFGVFLFFVLSGFLITQILLNAKKTGGSKMAIVKKFAIRRALRIFPAYYLFLLVLFLLNHGDIKQHIIYLLTYTSNFDLFNQNKWGYLAHTWSLAVEEQFYLIWPFLMLYVPDKYLLKVMIIITTLSVASSVVMMNIYGELSEVLPWNCICAFGIGGIYAYALQNPVIGEKIKKVFVWLLPMGIIFYFLNSFGVEHSFSRVAFVIIAVNILKYVVEEKHGRFTGAILNNTVLNNLGKMSYGIYLYHYVLPGGYLFLVNKMSDETSLSAKIKSILMHPAIAEIIQFIVLIGISYLSYQLIETQFLKYKKHFQINRAQKENFQLK